MPIVQVLGTDLSYALIAFDGLGQERAEESGELLSAQVQARIAGEPITDVFFMSHGWRGDVPAAQRQYSDWVRAMAACVPDVERARLAGEAFTPLLIGLHWPSEPWGDESLAVGGAPGFAASTVGTVSTIIEAYAQRLVDTPAAREQARSALETIFDAMQEDPTPDHLPAGVIAAYATLNELGGLGSSGPAGTPANDREPFDPDWIYQGARREEETDDLADVNFGQSTLGGLVLEPLRALSFWRMKERARAVGERGGNALLVALQQAIPAGRRVRFHLMGHSFGCIVVSATVAGPAGGAPLPQPVDSLVLVQGALSLWSYCEKIPAAPTKDGYFRRIVAERRVNGPIVTTQTVHDTAVGRYYPKGARGREWLPFGPGQQDQVSFEAPKLPKYGAVGTFGLRGDGLVIQDSPLAEVTEPYLFEPDTIYNLECSDIIKKKSGRSGAHSDIAHPEVAHAVWEAAWGAEPRLAFNGINCTTGAYLLPPSTPAEISRLARGEQFEKAHLSDLKHRVGENVDHYGVRAGVDQRKLSETGWGVIFAHDAAPAIRDALKELLDHRREQAGELYKEYRAEKGYTPNKTKNQFLVQNGAAPGPVDPKKMPYYLLIVGDPETIPFAFQYQLDVQFAVGRIHFDTTEEYARYAHSVVQAEKEGLALPRRAAFFAAQNPSDEATSLSAKFLASPLAHWLQTTQAGWSLDTAIKKDATKARLGELLGGSQTPAFLFTATHGAAFDSTDARQLPHQGALLCQDWPGPFGQAAGTPVSQQHYFAGDDVSDNAQLHGLISFHFACYGAGTPRFDDYAHRQPGVAQRSEIAPRAFVGALPKRLLAHPNGGALAVVGHVERAWGCSFLWGGRTREQTVTFESTLARLLAGYPIGAALEDFNERYAELAAGLSAELEDIKFGKVPDDLALSSLWTANNDARGYAIIGDPAVKLCVAPAGVTVTGGQGASIIVPAAASPSPSESTTSTNAAGGAPAAVPSGSVAFGAPDGDHPDLSAAVHQFVERITQILGRAGDEGGTATVSTYVTTDLGRAKEGKGGAGVDTAKAVTRLGAGGDIEAYVPSNPAEASPEVLQHHLEMVRQALAHRADLVKATLEAAGTLPKSV
jgi:hypothetical protein